MADDDDVEFLDRYARERGVGSRSAAVAQAVRLLRAARLGDDYAAAWTEWARVHPFQVVLPAHDTGLPADSKAQAEQVRAVDVQRLSRPVGRVPGHLLAALDDCLRLHLAF
jgi:mRNA-degrading endonuclease toxin of MazEF toxin-antitoxin module